jgi:hypothetical protein
MAGPYVTGTAHIFCGLRTPAPFFPPGGPPSGGPESGDTPPTSSPKPSPGQTPFPGIGGGAGLGGGGGSVGGIPSLGIGVGIFPGIGRAQSGFDPQGNQILYLGTAEITPTILIQESTIPAYADDQGEQVPRDICFDGEQAWVTADLTRWNETTYATIARRQRPILAGLGGLLPVPIGGFGALTPRGRWHTSAELGTMLHQEGCDHVLYVWFPYAGVPAFPGMPAGYRFKAARLITDDHNRMGARSRRIKLVWHCLPANEDYTQARLYDHNMDGVSFQLTN